MTGAKAKRSGQSLVAILKRVEKHVAPHLGTGKVVDYIPALAKADLRQFGMAVAAIDGRHALIGAASVCFSL